MSDNSLIAYQNRLPETRAEALSRSFYEWERRGRGWDVFDFPVELEPPFCPLRLFHAPVVPIIDDGRRESFFGNLFKSSQEREALAAQQIAEYEALSEQASEPNFCRYHRQFFIEQRLILPKDLNISKATAENLLFSFSYAAHPVSFEIIGNQAEIVLQFASAETDSFQVKQQLKAHLPSCSLIETDDYLENVWLNGDDSSVIADFGLSKEFMLPLETRRNFETDILPTIIGALANLQKGEVGVFQILFQRAKTNRAEEIMNAVRYFDGTPFFADAPEMIPLAKQKISRPLYAAVIRVAGKSRYNERTWQVIRNLAAGLSALANPTGNELIPLTNDDYEEHLHERGLLNRTSYRLGMILNSDELVSLVHPPTSSVVSEKLVRESEKTKFSPNITSRHNFIIGENTHQNETRQVSLSLEQRSRHIHLIGASGSGKSTLLLNLIKQDLENNQGLCVIDPHGDLIDEVIANVPPERFNDVVLFDASDSEFPIGFNILEAHSELEKNLLLSDLIAVFRRMATSWGDVMDAVLANATAAFLESETGGTLFDLKRFLTEADFRRRFLPTVKDEAVQYFWQHEFPLITGKPQASILIRLDSFLRHRIIRHIVCQKHSKLDFRAVMDNHKILLVKIPQGLIGEENAYLLGTLLISKLYQAASSRQDSGNRPFFACYLDEFQHFITPSMENVLSSVRKYNLGLVLAHQEFRQLQSRSAETAASVLSNCYTRICFRLGDTDAEKFASGFSFFDAQALRNTGIGESIARVERAEYDFNLRIALPAKVAEDIAASRKTEIIRLSRQNYATPKAVVEAGLYPSAQEVTDKVYDEHEIVSPAESGEKVYENSNSPKTSVSNKKDLPEPKTKPAPEKLKSRAETSAVAFDNGNATHRYLQTLIKRIGEKKGFVAVIEKEIFGGAGRIDVALENDHRKIAVEISVTTPVNYEIQNVRKCLMAGYDPVLMISSDENRLCEIRETAQVELTKIEAEKVIFLPPEGFTDYLISITKQEENPEPLIKGYKVNVEYEVTNNLEEAARKRTIGELLLNILGRGKENRKRK